MSGIVPHEREVRIVHRRRIGPFSFGIALLITMAFVVVYWPVVIGLGALVVLGIFAYGFTDRRRRRERAESEEWMKRIERRDHGTAERGTA